MISVGCNIRNNTDVLNRCDLKYLFDAIRRPKPEIASKIKQLRIIYQMNKAQYSELKRQLPYIVCGIFNPSIRKTENFAYTEYFIVDIDHIIDKGLVITDVRDKLTKDNRVMMCFASPSGDGLKIMFKLYERCHDAYLYKIFYKLFINEFSQSYGLQQVIDGSTCDVSRACFISEDPNIYFNPNCEKIELMSYINSEKNINEALELKSKVEEQIKIEEKQSITNKNYNIDREIMDQIRQTLNPSAKINREKIPVYIPETLENVMDDLKSYIEQKGINLTEIVNIQYGKKLHFKIGLLHAEINLFYGKRGFSVVQSSKTGTDSEMNKLMADVVEAYIAEFL